MQRAHDSTLALIETALDADSLRSAPEDLVHYGRDWTRVHSPCPSAVILPKDAEQLATALRLCNEGGVAVVPSGGRTGLAGGAVAARGEVVLSLDRLRRLEPVDATGATVCVGAGTVTQSLQEHCTTHDLFWPIDLAAKGSSQVGGNLSTNAGGLRVIRYGHARHWLLGLQVVLADGSLLQLGGANHKDNSGPDLKQCFVGSEGIFGVITGATLKLAPVPRRRAVLLFAVDKLESALEVLKAVRRSHFVCNAFEFFSQRCMDRLAEHRALRPPLEIAPYYLLIELDAPEQEALLAWCETILGPHASDGTVAQSETQAKSLWDLREGITESLAATGLPHKNDVALPIAALPAFCTSLESLFSERFSAYEVCLFGHLGDGNIHINVLKPRHLDGEAFHQQTPDLDRAIFALVRKHHGSIAAEHGIGLLKAAYLPLVKSPQELATLRGLKQRFDPRGILNPGKVLLA